MTFQTIAHRECCITASRQMYILILFLCSLLNASAVGKIPANLDFEQGQVGEVPQGWFVPQSVLASGYRVSLVTESPVSGNRCARIWYAGDSQSEGFGNLMQSFNAIPYRGKRIRFRAAVRAEVARQLGRGQLWLRVDRTGQKTGLFDNMGDRPIVSDKWFYYEIVGDVERDAEGINIGCMLIGKGKVWIDDVSFEVLGEAGVGWQPPRAFKGRGLENIIAFTRLLGYVRYFHASDQATATDWDKVAIEGVRIVEKANDAADLVQLLNNIFKPISPGVNVYVVPAESEHTQDIFKPKDVSGLELVAWRHYGYGFGTAIEESIYHSERIRKPASQAKLSGFADPAKPFIADLAGGVSCSVPLAVFADKQGTLPHISLSPTTPQSVLPDGFIPTGNDRSTRLAAVALCWNVMQHFYPYFDVVKTDWHAALSEALNSGATDSDERAFLDTLRRMVAKLKDDHADVFHGSDDYSYTLPLLWEWIEDKLVVTRIDPAGAAGLKVGDIIVKINGIATTKAVAQAEQLVSAATDGWSKLKALALLAAGEMFSQITVEVLRGQDKHINATILRTRQLDSLQNNRPEQFAELKPGIYYLNIHSLKEEQFKQALPALEKAKGIVVDFRGYPTISTVLISHLIDKPVTCARWHVPIITRPDRESLNFDFSNWQVQPLKPRLTANIAFITNARAISYAETYMGIVEHYKLGEIVGEPTAGTNGNIGAFTLPGKYNGLFTAMKVLKHNGEQHHGIGIIPTVPVHRTIKGVIEERDELLERALTVVTQ